MEPPNADSPKGSSIGSAAAAPHFRFPRLTRHGPPRRRRWPRRLVIAVVLLMAGWGLLFNSFITRLVVTRQMSRLTGAEVTASAVNIWPWSGAVAKDVVMRLPGLGGDAGRVLEVARARVLIRNPFTGSGGLATLVQRVELVGPVVRLSQSIETGRVNITGLRLPKSSGGAATIPTIIIRGGRVEIGEHLDDGQFFLTKPLRMSGSLTPDAAGAGVLALRLRAMPVGELAPGESRPAVQEQVDFDGRIDEQGIALTASNIQLAEWTPAPGRSRFSTITEMLRMQGSVNKLTLEYRFSGLFSASLALDQVAINLPIAAEGEVASDPSQSLMRMHQVNGTIAFGSAGVQATLDGLIEEVPYHVTLDYQGTDMSAPFVANFVTRRFRLDKDPRILRFAPPVVRERLATFSNPIGTVDIDATVRRGEAKGGQPGVVKVSGEIRTDDTVAAFDRFPYQFAKMTGTFRFSEDRIEVINVRGVSSTGATLVANGVIEPPTSDARVDIRVDVKNLKIDQQVVDAMSARRGRIMPVLFNQDRYDELVKSGLILTPAYAAELRAQAAKAEGPEAQRINGLLAATPEFELDGLAEVSVRVTRDFGPDSNWGEETHVYLHKANLLPEWFPVPIIAEGVRVDIKDESMRVSDGVYTTAAGGTGSVEAKVDYRLLGDANREGVPELNLRVDEVRSGVLTDYAIGAAIRRAGGDAAGTRVSEILGALNPDGRIDFSMTLGNAPDGDIRLDGLVQVTDLTGAIRSSFDGQSAAIDMSGVNGNVTISERGARIDMSGVVRKPEPGAVHDAADAGSFDVTSTILSGSEARDTKTTYAAKVRGLDVDLSADLEAIVGVFALDIARDLAVRKQSLELRGRVDGEFELASGPEDLRLSGGIDAARSVHLRSSLGEIEASLVAGRVEIGSGGRIGFDEARVELLDPNEGPAATVRLTGSIFASEDGVRPDAERPLHVEASAIRLSCPLVRQTVGAVLGESAETILKRFDPAGEVDVVADAGSPRRAHDPDAPAKWSVSGKVTPRSLGIATSEGRLEAAETSGTIDFNEVGGQINDLRASGEDWNFSLSGSWVLPGDGVIATDLNLGLKAASLTPRLVTLMPEPVRDTLKSMQFRCDGVVEIPSLSIRVTESPEASASGLRVSGTVRVADAALSVGAPITQASGQVEFLAQREGKAPVSVELLAILDACRLSGIGITEGRVRLQSRPAHNDVVLPLISANCHAGRIAGSAWLGPPREEGREYQADIALSGVHFGPFLQDLNAEPGTDRELATIEPGPTETDRARGLLDARVSMGGVLGIDASRRGRGAAVVGGGRVVDFPLVIALVRVSNLQLPVSEPLSLATATFYMDGPTIAFEDLSLYSDSLSILGFGTLNWSTQQLDLRFNSRALNRIPVVSWFVESIRDELITTSVTGKLSDPLVSTVPFDQTVRLLSELFGGVPTPGEARMLDLERDSIRERARNRPQFGGSR